MHIIECPVIRVYLEAVFDGIVALCILSFVWDCVFDENAILCCDERNFHYTCSLSGIERAHTLRSSKELCRLPFLEGVRFPTYCSRHIYFSFETICIAQRTYSPALYLPIAKHYLGYMLEVLIDILLCLFIMSVFFSACTLFLNHLLVSGKGTSSRERTRHKKQSKRTKISRTARQLFHTKQKNYGTYTDLEGGPPAQALLVEQAQHDLIKVQPRHHGYKRRDSDAESGHSVYDDPNNKEDFERVRKLAFSTEGPVDIVQSRQTGKLYVTKTVKATEVEGKYLQAHEVRILTEHLEYQYRNIIRLFDCTKVVLPSGGRFWQLRLEYCSGGDLFSLISAYREARFQIPRLFIIHTFIGLMQALIYLHERLWYDEELAAYTGPVDFERIIHQDIKPENVFLKWTDDNTTNMPNIVLADFGLASTENKCFGAAGTRGFVAPEAADLEGNPRYTRQKVCTTASDTWSLGATLFMLTNGGARYRTSTIVTMRGMTMTGAPETSMLQILERMLREWPFSRPDTCDLMNYVKLLKYDMEDIIQQSGPVDDDFFDAVAHGRDPTSGSVSPFSTLYPSSERDQFQDFSCTAGVTNPEVDQYLAGSYSCLPAPSGDSDPSADNDDSLYSQDAQVTFEYLRNKPSDGSAPGGADWV